MPLALRGGARLRSVVNTFIGLWERMAHTMTIPSWDVTADSEPDSKNAVTVQNDAWSAPEPCNGCRFKGESKAGRASWESGVGMIRMQPGMPRR